MIAAEIIRQVRSAGGHIAPDGADLVLTAPRPLPPDLLARLEVHKTDILAALAHPDPIPPLSPAAEARRQKVLDMLRDGRRFAIHVEDATSDPVIATLAIRDKGTCELRIPQGRYDAFKVLEMVERWEREPDPLWWRVAITEPGGKRFEVDAASGMSLGEWATYAERFYGLGSTVAPLAELPGPSGPGPPR